MASIKVLYFAGLREALGLAGETVAVPAGVATIAELRAHLAARGENHGALTTTKNLRAALNQRMVEPATPIADGYEVAFFPPVTGG